jgi:hypothetical protein
LTATSRNFGNHDQVTIKPNHEPMLISPKHIPATRRLIRASLSLDELLPATAKRDSTSGKNKQKVNKCVPLFVPLIDMIQSLFMCNDFVYRCNSTIFFKKKRKPIDLQHHNKRTFFCAQVSSFPDQPPIHFTEE